MAQSSRHVSYVMAMLCLFIANAVTHARRPTTYFVGGQDGWDPVILMDTWARGKTFYAGDILVFKYDDQRSNVVVVNRIGYETCTANEGAVEYSSGNDRIQLHYGYNYFIGTYTPEDCSTGLKMAIKALAPI
ncbi:hypothetical protein CARUB_v10011266mg [Capsella rubella]|uniref:Basic blue protein n=1 Tax=Capsella rubella TaxID=81985 RepID=R0I529_9BRAS|nr:basic blue protein [Capsella rubella]EOA37394.1 hypothetical protein CARUB_v10011266mg [Capsella rubella]